jgi:hypothetical protein
MSKVKRVVLGEDISYERWLLRETDNAANAGHWITMKLCAAILRMMVRQYDAATITEPKRKRKPLYKEQPEVRRSIALLRGQIEKRKRKGTT